MLPEFREEPNNNQHVGFSSRVKVTSGRRSLSGTRVTQPIEPRVSVLPAIEQENPHMSPRFSSVRSGTQRADDAPAGRTGLTDQDNPNSLTEKGIA